MKKTALLLAIAAAVLPATVSAQNYAKMAEDRFKAADTNKDGKLSKAEAQSGMPRVYTNFDKIDTDKDGYLTLDQVKAAMSSAQK